MSVLDPNEFQFVSIFWRAASAEDEASKAWAWKASAMVAPEMLTDAFLRPLYDNLRVRFSEGETLELPIVHRDLQCDYDLLCDIQEDALPPSLLIDYAKVVVKEAQSREFGQLCSKALDHLSTGKVTDGGKATAERMALRLMNIYSGAGEGTQGFKTRDQVVQEAKDRAMHESYGVTLPWESLEHAGGPLVPGEIMGVTAYSGEGKSTLASNLFNGFIDNGVPCIALPTEMGVRWLDRAVAARARVDQWRAEKQRWKGGEEQRERFIAAYEAIRALQWLMVERSDISPTEAATAVRVLRKRWDGPVVFIGDHVHRFNYGSESADDKAGDATRMFKNLAGDLGLIGVLLYQPRKPAMGTSHHGPVAGHQIRGHSSIWNELDIHISPYRAWVKTNTAYGLTPWGTVACDYKEGTNVPRFCKPDDEYGKLDDQHIYIKVDKLRVGGEGPTVILNYDKPSGRIYESPKPQVTVAA